MKAKIVVLIFLIFVLVFAVGCVQSFRNPNPALCEEVSLQQNKDTCYHRAALTKGDDFLCSKIVNLNERDNCYMDLAVGSSQFVD
jgi:hypothetical protein